MRREGATILVVDDEPVILRFLSLILMRAGHCVVAAEDGVSALRKCAENGYQIDLAISDVLMPDLSGPEMLARLREVLPDLPGILVSGFPGQEVGRKKDRFLQKPFRADQVLAAVGELLSQASRLTLAAA